MSIPMLIGLFLSIFSGFVSSATVTLESIMIFQTHELLKVWKPDVYFECKSENKTDLPDVKILNHIYTFNGQESWQPLTELSEKKCKRCGFYEKDIVTRDTFHEWEFCPFDFTAEGKYLLFKDKEVNATFSCPNCIQLKSPSDSQSGPGKERKGMHAGVIILISTLVLTVFVLGSISMFKYWQKKKRQEDQARFLKLFEEGDDIEDELELGNVL